ncbi:MAG TPA: arginase [Gemmatimonadales bacterium]|nr:arginase [Gemmatimonadales bacterium]
MGRIRIIGVPLDLGASRRGVDMGPSALRIAQLERRLEALGHEVEDSGNVDVPEREELADVQSALDLLPAITEVCRELAGRTARAIREGWMPLVLGGDHSLGAGSVAGVSTAYAERGERIGLIWLDAHGDINTPSSSLSGNVHGMPVAHLLGHGDPALVALASPAPAVRAENTVIVGVRDLDPAEREHARTFGLRIFTMRDVDERGLREVMREAIEIATRGTAGFHVSCDADWIDPAEAPGVGTPVRGGATYREGHLAMEMMADTGRMVSMDMVEINPVLDEMNRTAELCVGLVTSGLGLRIL